MAPNRITRGRAVRRAPALAALVFAVLALGACGGGGGETTTAVPDQEGDAELLNEVLSRQIAAVDAYEAVLPGMRGFDRALAIRFRTDEQEHVVSIVKTLRGLGAAPQVESQELEPEEVRTPRERLAFLYEVESATIDQELNAISELTAPWPRALLGSIVANQAQHLALLRRALGAPPLEAVPEAFEDGTVPAPGE
jgi:Ferritin-like domain